MKRLMTLAVLLPSLSQAATIAAPVTAVTQHFREVTVTRNVCVTETVTPSEGNPVLGAVIGGAIGSAVSGKGNKTMGTGVGAIAGAVIGDNVGRQPTTQQRCHPESTVEQQPAGYRVTYRVGNQEFTQIMDRNPGNYVSVTITAR